MMNTLYEVDPGERLLARGEYEYQLSGKASGLTEAWSLHRLPDEAIIHRAEVGKKIAAIRLRQLSHFVLSPDYRPNRLEMEQEIDGQIARTRVTCWPEALSQAITTANEATKMELAMPAGYSLFLPPVSAQSFIVRHYDLAAGGRQALPLASLRIQPEGGLPLSIEVQMIDYEYVGMEEVETPAGQFTCRQFIRYDQHMRQRLWLDEAWTVIQWSVPYSPIMRWEYLLRRYQREV